MERFMELLQNFQTEKVMETLQEWRIGDLIHHPWFLGTVGALALLCLFMRWRVMLAGLLGLVGFVWLLSYTLERGTELSGLSDGTLLVFVGGGVCILAITIYLLFLKSD